MRKIRCMVSLLIGCFVLTAMVHADSRKVILDASELEREGQLVNLRMDRNANRIILNDMELIEDDAPATGIPEGYDTRGTEWIENLKKGIVIKKILMLDNPSAHSGRLLFKGIEVKGNTQPLHIQINGVRIERPATLLAYPKARQYLDLSWDRWFVVDIPVDVLRRGENEILMWAETDSTSWRVLIAHEQEFARGSLKRPKHPNRSMKSSDGGSTWSDNRLGPRDSIDGEYSIRLSLDRHVHYGTYTSPVMDIITDSPLKKLSNISRITFDHIVEEPAGTGSEVFVRFGSSPNTEDPTWTEWYSLKRGRMFEGPGRGRYFQVKADMSTSNLLVTPGLRQISFEAEWDDLSPNKKTGVAVNVIHNGRAARSSIPFGYENLEHPELTRFRRNARLDNIVKGAQSEFEVMMLLLNWSYLIPVTEDRYSWNWNDVVKLERGQRGMPRLQSDYTGRRRDAMCLYSNQALIGALLSMGYQARHINIHSEGASGHEVTEVWSNEFNKWIYMDATRDFYWFHHETGVPYNLLEVHNLLKEHVPIVETWQRPFLPEFGGPEFVSRIPIGFREGENKFSVEKDARNHIGITGHFRIIPRNDFLTNPLPVPVHTGATMWGWDGFLNWYDEKFPRRYEYQLYTDRALDFYEPLNQAEVHLHETSEPGLLAVEIHTFTPGFDTFVVRVDDGIWRREKLSKFQWQLKPGKNVIEVRTRNVRGVLGPISKLEVTYNP